MSTLIPNTYVCVRCLRNLPRTYFSQARRNVAKLHTSSPPNTGFANLNSRRLISLSGQDAPKYLQGLIAANVPAHTKTSGGGFYSAFLNAQGRVLYDVFIYPSQGEGQDGGFLIEVDTTQVESLYKHLKRFKLRAKVGLRIVDDGELKVWSNWGKTTPLPKGGHRDLRIPEQNSQANMGSRIILSGSQNPEIEAEEVPSSVYDIRRMQLGVPEGQREILKESALPQESEIDYMGGIDFRKGCYVGQELTIRTHHTGVVRKRILPVQLYDASDATPGLISFDDKRGLLIPPEGSNISRIGRKGRSAGKWLGGVGNIGLALCRLEIMTDTVISGEGSQHKAEDEFEVTWGGSDGSEGRSVRVKAFIPWWHAVRAAEQNVQKPNG